MNKKLLTTMMLGFLLLLSACNGNTESDSESGEEGNSEEQPSETEESGDGNEEESGEASVLSADELIDGAQENWADTESYELNQIYVIENREDSNPIRTITTHSDQNELKIAVNSDDLTTTHYIIDGEHYIYKGEELELQDGEVDIENSTYSDLLSQLDNYRSGEVTETENGYSLDVQFENQEDTGALLSEDAAGIIEDGDDVSGGLTLTFDDEYKYDGGELTAVINSDGEEYELSSTISIERIGNIPVIEKPSGM